MHKLLLEKCFEFLKYIKTLIKPNINNHQYLFNFDDNLYVIFRFFFQFCNVGGFLSRDVLSPSFRVIL